jgi:hypothetical protein
MAFPYLQLKPAGKQVDDSRPLGCHLVHDLLDCPNVTLIGLAQKIEHREILLPSQKITLPA